MSDRSRLRIVLLRVMVVSILLTLLGRLTYMQVAEGANYRNAASANRTRDVITAPARGQILDDRGVALVTNRIALVVSVDRSELPAKKKGGSLELSRLSLIVGIPVADIERIITPCIYSKPDGTRVKAIDGCWKGSPYQPVPIASYRSDALAQVRRMLKIVEQEENFPGVSVQYEAVRDYPAKTLAAHALGYLGPLSDTDLKQDKYKRLAPGTQIGRAGVEAVYDDQLRGQDGVRRLLVDKDGNTAGVASETPAIAGQNLVLSIDSGVQRAAEAALQQQIAKTRTMPDTSKDRSGNFKATTGAAITVEVNTGRVVAMASYPRYDPTDFVGGISTKKYTELLNAPGHPLISNAVQGSFAPGSTFKIVSTSAAIKSGAYNLKSYIPCPSSYLGKRNFEGESFGTLDFRETLIRSCDTVFYQIALNLWKREGGRTNKAGAPEYLANEARDFGFGKKTGIDLPDERAGVVPDRAWKLRYWKQVKGEYCKGAKRRPKTDPQQRVDQIYCDSGYFYEGGDAMNLAIGQGDVLVTPLQLAMAYSAMVNGGTLYKPQLAKGFVSADGRTSTEIKKVVTGRLDVPAAVRTYITSALAGVTKPPGTAKGTFADFPLGQVDVGGKTGTAEVANNKKAPTSWFASFAPVVHPRYVTVVMVTEGGTGGTTAAPVVKKIWDAVYGLQGAKSPLKNGALPVGMPCVRADGTIASPPCIAPRTVTVSPSPSASTGTHALGLPWSEEARRRQLS
ncbi:MAG: penicillin-binding protein 2 [Frankiales bacterium]|nr:penicillin-binding protein 2 [Frankiales bacterium]